MCVLGKSSGVWSNRICCYMSLTCSPDTQCDGHVAVVPPLVRLVMFVFTYTLVDVSTFCDNTVSNHSTPDSIMYYDITNTLLV